MKVYCSLIIKTLHKNKHIKVIIKSENKLPTFELNATETIIDQVINFFKEEFKFAWTTFNIVDSNIIDHNFYVFFTTFLPPGFLDEKYFKITSDYSNFDIKIQQSIQQALCVSPYIGP